MAAWDISTAGKLFFLISLIAGSVGLGYLARRLGVGEKIARIIMYFVLTVPYTLVSFLSIWKMHFDVAFAVLPVIAFVLMCSGLAMASLAARSMKMERSSAGAFVLATGASNHGFTMGGFVSYALFGVQGLGVAAIYTMYWDFGMVFALYPVARHYGAGQRQPAWKLIAANFLDIRSLSFFSSLAGLALNVARVRQPEIVTTSHIVDILIIGGAAISFFTTGLRLHFENLHLHKKLYAIAAGIKFLFVPAVGLAAVGLLRWAGYRLPSPGEQIILIQASTPTAIYAVIISNLFHLDDRLASINFVVNTAIYLAIVMPVVVLLLGPR